MRILPIKNYEPTFGRPSANPRIPHVAEPSKPLEIDKFTKTILENPLLFFTKY
jgi:hypothetical protein